MSRAASTTYGAGPRNNETLFGRGSENTRRRTCLFLCLPSPRVPGGPRPSSLCVYLSLQSRSSLCLFLSLGPQVIAGVEELLDAEKQVHDHDEQDTDTEADEGALPLGSGVLGRGMPLMVGRGPTARPLQDGAGLCSPGRWSPSQRTVVTQKDIVELRLLLRHAIDELLSETSTTALELVERVTSADCQAAPFPDSWTVALRDAAHDIFGQDSRPRPEDRHCDIRLRLLRSILAAAGDPDAEAMLGYIEGVAIGVDTRMPRTPAVYARKRRWTLEGQRERKQGYLEEVVPLEWRSNYRSARVQAEELERQLDQLTAEGKFLRMSEAEARDKWPEATPAALGALEKLKDDGSVAVRILYDGSHGVDINMRIRQRDQDSGPCAADIKRVLREQSAVGQSLPRTITVDIEDAHRVVNVREQDWRFQLCRARDDGPVYASKVGMFGVSSISYLWGRLAGAALRALSAALHVRDRGGALGTACS